MRPTWNVSSSFCSLSPGMDPTFTTNFFDLKRERCGAEPWFWDISHKHLEELVEKKPLPVKPNDEEVADGVDVHNEADALLSPLHKIHERGAKNILLHACGDGAYFFNGEHVPARNAAQVEVLDLPSRAMHACELHVYLA